MSDLRCLGCEKTLTGGLDTYGDRGQEFCFDCWNDVTRQESMPMYGRFIGGDPRNFTPDPDCSDPEDRERHRQHCAAWDAGNPCTVSVDYGLGVNEKGIRF